MALRLGIAALTLLALAVSGQAAAAGEALRLAVQNEHPPFSFRDADGELQGFDVEIAAALCATLKADCELVPLEFAELIPGLQDGRIDAAVASM
jgi:ABC-type amino acid transport substrate-binding protein